MSERMSNNSEASPKITRYDSLENLGEFNKEAAMQARAEKAESTKEKETEEFAYDVNKVNEYVDMMEEAMSHNASQAVINTIAAKIAESVGSSTKLNETVNDEDFREFVEKNPLPF